MADLSKEWCEVKATEWGAMQPNLHHSIGDAKRTAQALRIAARVLDEGAPTKLRAIITRQMVGNALSVPTTTDEAAAQAVINYLLEGKE